jgi:ATP-binding protein involved in chromosome partitioning
LVDPRTSIIEDRLKGIKNIIAVSSGKGGVGKSLVASTLSLIISKKGHRVGLFDLDFTSPSTHIILGVEDLYPEEKYGLIPPEVFNVKYMSIVYYSRGDLLPLRGLDISNALIELLSVTIWDTLDLLVIDMPPGISDTVLDLIRLIKGIKFLLVTTPSQLSFQTVKNFVKLLKVQRIPVIGIIENMKFKESNFIKRQVYKMDQKFWGEIPFDTRLEETIGDVNNLLESVFSKRLSELIEGNMTF